MKGACPRGHLLSGREQGQQGTNSSPAGAEGHKAGLWDHPPPCTDKAGMQKMVGKQKTGGFQNCWKQAPASLLVRVLVPGGEVWGTETAQ